MILYFPSIHMGQFVQGGKNGRLMFFFFFLSRASIQLTELITIE